MHAALILAGKIALLLGLVPVVALALAVHEAGHLAAGRAVGFRPLLFVVGPLRIEWLVDRRRTTLNRDLALYGGVTVVVPRDTQSPRNRLRWVMAGGPLASLITGAFVLAAWYALDPGSFTREDALPAYYAGRAVELFAVLSLGLGVVTLLPNRFMGMPSDGARLLELSRSGPVHERDLAVILLGLVSAGGDRPAAWDGALVARAASIVDDSLNGVLGQLLAYYYELDSGRPEAAGTHLDNVLRRVDRMAALHHGTILLEGAYYAAVHRTDPTGAREWLSRARKLPAEAHLRHRAEAAVLVAEADFSAAVQAVERAEQALDKSIEAGLVLAHRDELGVLREAAQRESAVIRQE